MADKFIATTALKKIMTMRKRIRIVQGGSSAGKTIAILAVLIDTAQTLPGKTISVVSETHPHLKRGAIRDFQTIMETQGYFNPSFWNKTDSIYTFDNGSKIEFFSAENQDKVRGPRRDILFINECNNISYNTYTQLAIRTNDYVFLDFNPVGEFWVHTELKPKDNADFIILTYKDNEALPQTVIDELESRKNNKYFWTVYGLGEIGAVEGRVYKDWEIIETIPHEARLERYGLDFGYTNDPTAIVAIYYYNGGWILDECLYQRGQSNRAITDVLKNLPSALVLADSAEPKSIDEIAGYGINIMGVMKGKGSKKQGINYVQDQKISVTQRSKNIIREYQNYLWLEDRDGNFTQEPVDGNDHAMDAILYAFNGELRKNVQNIIDNREIDYNTW